MASSDDDDDCRRGRKDETEEVTPASASSPTSPFWIESSSFAAVLTMFFTRFHSGSASPLPTIPHPGPPRPSVIPARPASRYVTRSSCVRTPRRPRRTILRPRAFFPPLIYLRPRAWRSVVICAGESPSERCFATLRRLLVFT